MQREKYAMVNGRMEKELIGYLKKIIIKKQILD
jgi:hypothetical protein